MSDPTDYAAKIADLEEAKARVESLIANLPDSPEKRTLQMGWRRTFINNIRESNPMPWGEYELGNTFSINGGMWPPGREIALALTAYHDAFKAARHAFNALAVQGVPVSPPEA